MAAYLFTAAILDDNAAPCKFRDCAPLLGGGKKCVVGSDGKILPESGGDSQKRLVVFSHAADSRADELAPFRKIFGWAIKYA